LIARLAVTSYRALGSESASTSRIGTFSTYVYEAPGGRVNRRVRVTQRWRELDLSSSGDERRLIERLLPAT
jgi:hypothetical protein